MRVVVKIAFVFLLFSCDKKEFFDGIDFYQDGFESYSSYDELLIEDDVNWSFNQITRESNAITLVDNFSHSGNYSLRFDAEPTTDDGASKASIAKHNFAFWEGETVRLSAWYYIEGDQDLQWLFIMDLEERTPIGAGPGMRLAIVDDQLLIEHKYYEPNITQAEGSGIAFPRDEWVHVEWEVSLSQKKEGSVRVWQNNQLVISNDNHRTLPSDLLYFQQGTKGQYSSCEIGITANSFKNPCTLWVDDVQFEKTN